MRNIFVVESPSDWPISSGEFEVVSDTAYLTDPSFQDQRNLRVFNLCKSYRYQTSGYYVSLLAAARGHKPIPSVATIEDMKSISFVRITSDNLEQLIQKSLSGIRSKSFELSIYFGKNLAQKYDRLARELSKIFAAPMIRAKFVKKDQWMLSYVSPIALKDVPKSHQQYLVQFAKDYFRNRNTSAKPKAAKFSLAILIDPNEKTAPSNEKAIKKFIAAAQKLEMEVELIEHADFRRLAEFDALFIRETTNVNHHTFRFAQKAKALGLVVIDDPDSILKCSNKVYLTELLKRHKIAAPRTKLIHKANWENDIQELSLPCIVKQPDSSFSLGVIKVEDPKDLRVQTQKLLEESDLILAQEFMPTEFDWRVGIIDRRPLYVCRYYMARSHWQIYKRDGGGKLVDGKSDTLTVEDAPPKLIRFALKAASLIGDGFYGLDVKEVDGKYYLIEINDNPSIDAGVEDEVLKEQLYLEIMKVFLNRLMAKTEGTPHE